MLFTFLQKQQNIKKQRKLIETMIVSLNISQEQKDLYFKAIEVMSLVEAKKLYKNLTKFIKEIELKEISEIQRESFSSISGMRKKEAREKAQELNSFSFLLHNL